MFSRIRSVCIFLIITRTRPVFPLLHISHMTKYTSLCIPSVIVLLTQGTKQSLYFPCISLYFPHYTFPIWLSIHPCTHSIHPCIQSIHPCTHSVQCTSMYRYTQYTSLYAKRDCSVYTLGKAIRIPGSKIKYSIHVYSRTRVHMHTCVYTCMHIYTHKIIMY